MGDKVKDSVFAARLRKLENLVAYLLVHQSAVQQFTLISVHADHLRCTPNGVDGLPKGPTLEYIAKPYLLRRTPFDGFARINGISYTYQSDIARVARLGSEEELQVISPAYLEGDLIFAAPVLPHTNAEREEGLEPLRFLDLNSDARAWAVVET